MQKLLGNISELRIVSSRCDLVPTIITISLLNKKASNWVCLIVILQKLIIDNFRSLAVSVLEFVRVGSQGEPMLMLGVLTTEFDDSCAYSNLLPSELTLQWGLFLTKIEPFLILIYLYSVLWSIRDLFSVVVVVSLSNKLYSYCFSCNWGCSNLVSTREAANPVGTSMGTWY